MFALTVAFQVNVQSIVGVVDVGGDQSQSGNLLVYYFHIVLVTIAQWFGTPKMEITICATHKLITCYLCV